MFKGIVDLSFPNFLKYLYYSAPTNTGLFAAETEQIISSVPNNNYFGADEDMAS